MVEGNRQSRCRGQIGSHRDKLKIGAFQRPSRDIGFFAGDLASSRHFPQNIGALGAEQVRGQEAAVEEERRLGAAALVDDPFYRDAGIDKDAIGERQRSSRPSR